MGRRLGSSIGFGVLLVFMAAGCSDNAYRQASDNDLARLSSRVDPQNGYRLHTGDKVKVLVFGEGDLSGTFEVNAAGNLALPLAGEVQARGRTLPEVREAMIRRLSQGFLKSPRVALEMAGYRPIYVHGEVRTGGEFAFKAGLRLQDAVAMAGGYSYRANESYVLLQRQGEGQTLRIALPSSLVVLPGDNIRIPERMF